MIVCHVACDYCGRREVAQHSKVHITRTGLKAGGWLVGLRSGMDVCPACVREFGLHVGVGGQLMGRRMRAAPTEEIRK